MPRGDNPNSRKNLIQNQGLSREEVEKVNAKGGIASGETRRAQASFNEAMREVLTPERAKKIAEIVVKRAEQGNLKAYELVRDQIGEKPVEKVEQTNVEVNVQFEDE